MNEPEIEELLRKAPKAAPPADLKLRLQRAVRVTPPAEDFDFRSWPRRWMPALSFGVFLLACMVAVGMQTSTIAQLKRQNVALHTSAQSSTSTSGESTEYKQLRAAAQDLERLRRDKADLATLQKEVGELRAATASIDAIKTDNQRLRTSIAQQQARLAAATAADMTPEQLEKERAKAQVAGCVNKLKQIGLAARTWSTDNGDVLPPDFASMTKELNNPKLLICPADTARTISVAAGDSSYQIISPGIGEDWPADVYAVCPIHGVLLLVDGSVQNVGADWKQKIKVVNGHTIFGR